MKQPSVGQPALASAFQQIAKPAKSNKTKRKYPPPFSLRLSAEERAYLEEKAGHRPLGAYIRETLLGERANKRKILRKPHINDQQIATVLSALGDSRLASNLNQLAYQANIGSLEVTEELEQELEHAYQAIIAMRDALFMALGMQSGGGA